MLTHPAAQFPLCFLREAAHFDESGSEDPTSPDLLSQNMDLFCFLFGVMWEEEDPLIIGIKQTWRRRKHRARCTVISEAQNATIWPTRPNVLVRF